MPRCIVLIRSHEPLQEGWRKRAFGPAGPLLDDRVRVAGVSRVVMGGAICQPPDTPAL